MDFWSREFRSHEWDNESCECEYVIEESLIIWPAWGQNICMSYSWILQGSSLLFCYIIKGIGVHLLDIDLIYLFGQLDTSCLRFYWRVFRGFQHRSALRSFLDNLSTSEQSFAGVTTLLENTVTVVGNSNKQDNNKARQQPVENGKVPGIAEGAVGGQTAQARLVDLLESTLWNRKLAPTSEEIVNALVQQLFEGIRDHFVAAAELKVSLSLFTRQEYNVSWKDLPG